MKSRAGYWRRTGLLGMLAIPFVYPFLFLVGAATKTQHEYLHNKLGFSTHLTTAHLRYAWVNASMGRAVLNSFIAVSISVVVIVVVSAAGGYWFLRHQGRIARTMLVVLIGAWAIPFVVFALPLYTMLSTARLTNSLIVLGFVYAAMNAPFGLYLAYTYFKQGIPPELRDAASIDGAGSFQEFRHIIFPLGRPALATLAALSFVWSWGDLLDAVFLMQDPGKYTVTVAAATLVNRFDAAIQQSAAAAVIGMVPVVFVFLIAQRAITRGFTAGVGK